MTVTYTAEVATCRGFGCFLKLLARWRGSIYKLVWMDLIAFLLLYYLLSCVYRFALDAEQKSIFESIVHYCNSYGALIPLSFVLGFYVSIVMTRWWDQYMTIPWPDPVAVYVSAHVHGQDERGRVMRRTVMRYVCLCLTMVLINMSPRVKKRFPTLDHLVDAGLLVESEKVVIQGFDLKFPKHPKNWMPIVWASSIITRARKEGRIRDDFSLKTIIDELNKFRGMCTVLMHYDAISIPLVYTQVVTLAVYSYFLCNIMGKQWVQRKDKHGYYNIVDNYFPVFTTLEFFFYMGWLKVAESLINPFGEDDDDFEVNWLIDRNLQVSYLIVDEMHHEHPDLIKDQYWDEVFPNELPYANETEGYREEPPEPSTARVDVTKTAMAQTLSAVRVDVGDTNKDTSNLNGKIHQSYSNLSVFSKHKFGSTLKNFLSRGDQSIGDARDRSSETSSSSSPPLSRTVSGSYPAKPTANKKLADEIIEEEDEQQTLTNQRQLPTDSTARPPLPDLFMQTSEISFKSLHPESSIESDIDHSRDDFERLRKKREKERLERRKQKYARTIGNAANRAGDASPGEVPAQISTLIPVATAVIPAATSTPEARGSAERVSLTLVVSRSSLQSSEEETKEQREARLKREQQKK